MDIIDDSELEWDWCSIMLAASPEYWGRLADPEEKHRSHGRVRIQFRPRDRQEQRTDVPNLRFKCSSCDAWHEEFPDMGYDQPSYAHDIPAADRARRLFLTSDLCALDDQHFFVRCVLPIPIKDHDEAFSYGIWSSLSKDNFLRYQQFYDDDLSNWDPMFGWLSNRLPGYPNTLSLKLSVQTQKIGNRPIATLEPTDHPLAIEQREGITLGRLIEIIGPSIHH